MWDYLQPRRYLRFYETNIYIKITAMFFGKVVESVRLVIRITEKFFGKLLEFVLIFDARVRARLTARNRQCLQHPILILLQIETLKLNVSENLYTFGSRF